MEPRRKAKRSASSGGIAESPKHPGAEAATLNAYTYLQTLLDTGGQVLLGTVQPIKGAAVAHDGKTTLANAPAKTARVVARPPTAPGHRRCPREVHW